MRSALLFSVVLAACGPPAPTPVGRIDAGLRDAGRRDASTPDAARDEDAPVRDGGRDGGGALDAEEAWALLLEVCTAEAAWCDAVTTCGCAFSPCNFEECRGRAYERSQLFAAHPLTMDRDALDACVAERARAASTCELYRDHPALCPAAIVELVALGEPCTITGRCAGGAGICEVGLACRAPGSDADFCTESSSCADGLVCADHRCAALGATGAACSALVPCADELACRGGICAAPAATDEPCAISADCARSLVCVAGTCTSDAPRCSSSAACGTSSVCIGLVTNDCFADVAAGGACETAHECGPGSFCDASGQCALVPRVDEACESVCEEGLRCDLTTHRCVVARGEGAPCRGDATCISGLVCRSSVCAEPAGEGELCGAGECGPGLGCREFACVPQVGEGGRCSRDHVCTSDLYCDTTSHCAPRALAGSTCLASEDCAPGLFCGTSPADPFTPRCQPRREVLAGCSADGECVEGAHCSPAVTGECLPEICAAIQTPL